MADSAALSTIEPYLRGRPCPNCGFARQGDELGPREHCPSCNNPYPELLPPLGTRSAGASLLADPSTWALVAANLLTIAAALETNLRLHDLMLVYWLQSVMIGISFLVRMLVRIGEGWSDPFGPEQKYFNPGFFVVHYGGFHLGYLIFLKPSMNLAFFGPFGVCVLAFALCHAYSLWHNIRRDRAAEADVTTMFWLPYARIIPMHLTIIVGPQIAIGGLALFLALKTAADTLMHVAEHAVLRAR